MPEDTKSPYRTSEPQHSRTVHEAGKPDSPTPLAWHRDEESGQWQEGWPTPEDYKRRVHAALSLLQGACECDDGHRCLACRVRAVLDHG